MFGFYDFRPRNKGIRKILGDLETDIMEEMWRQNEASVRDIYENLRQKRKIAYTTISTIMTRLVNKGLLKKRKEGQAFIYVPSLSRADLEKKATTEIVHGLVEGFGAQVVSCLLSEIKEGDPDMLDELERYVQEQKKTRKTR